MSGHHNDLVQRTAHTALIAALLALETLPAGLPAFASTKDEGLERPRSGQRDTSSDASSKFHNGWREGAIEAGWRLCAHLSGYALDAVVEGEHAKLYGRVGQEIERALAEAVALGVDGIASVDNHIDVVPALVSAEPEAEAGTIARRVEDATITARVKTELLGNAFIDGMAINVDTDNGQVVLNGTVRSEAARALATQLARNVRGVTAVETRLLVETGPGDTR